MIALASRSADFQKRFGDIVAKSKNPRSILAAAGREGGNQLKKHFREKDRTEGNTLAPDRRSHLWNKIAQSVQAPVISDRAATIDVTHPIIPQKVFGGPIIAKRAKALTIPISGEAYGRSTATFEQETGLQLFVLKKKNDPNGRGGLLAAAEGQGIKVHYLLTPRVDQEADPTALPEPTEFAGRILARAMTVLVRQIAKGQAN
jgi:hypothetical protein